MFNLIKELPKKPNLINLPNLINKAFGIGKAGCSSIQCINNIENKQPPKIKGKIYWATRDLATGVPGNHHLIIVELDDKSACEELKKEGITCQEEKGRYFFTMAAFNNERLQYELNNKTDVKAVKEYFNPNKHTSWYEPDFDLEIHEVKPPTKYSDEDEFIKKLIYSAKNYTKNEAKENVEYSLWDENCAAWVNSLFKATGVDDKTRIKKGIFDGIDWGEEDELPSSLFK
jgi:hypothetical protein